MTRKSNTIATKLLVGYLFALLAVTLVKCDDEKDHEGPTGSNPFGALGNFGDLTKFGESGLGSMFKSMTDGGNSAFNDFMGSFTGPKVVTGGKAENSAEKRESAKENTGFMGMKDPMDFFKLMLNPMEFMNRIAKEFKLDRNDFTQAVGRGMNLGLETALQPPMVCIKVIEKVFVPDSCKLKFVCDMGKQMAMFKGQMPKFPDSYFDGATTAKALYDGASGRECEQVYSCNGEGPKLKKEFAGLKQKYSSEGHGGEHGDESGDYAASQQSRVTAQGPVRRS